MDFLNLAKERFSVRSFKPDTVADEIIEQILEAGHVAPTACNKQPQKVIVVKTPEALERLRKCTECHFNAPLVFIVGYDTERCWVRPHDGKASGEIDASIVATHMMLEAASLGIGSTWVMIFEPETIRAQFETDDNFVPVALLTMGYAADGCKPSKLHERRRDAAEIVSAE